MAFDFRYPTPGGTGASLFGNLVTACGTYDPFSGGGTVSIRGKIYSGSSTPTEAVPPLGSGSSVGFVVPSSNTWHFNGCLPTLAGCASTGQHVMRVWLTSTSVSFHLIKDCLFTACVSGSSSCPTPDCPVSAPQPPEGIDPGGPVICDVASRYFLVVPTAGLVQLLDVFGVPNPQNLAILLTFDDNRSTFHCAVWSSKVVRGEQLRLEVTRGGCCNRALLARVRVTSQQVFTLERWTSDCFDVLHGAEMQALTHDGQWCEGSVLVKPPPGSLPIAAPLVAGEVAPPLPVKKSSRRRGRR